uniref:U6-Eretoxin-Ek1l_1 n=1 Tax=Eresus cinnaberinus TaxID=175337 RepID=A0A2D0PCP1_ERECI
MILLVVCIAVAASENYCPEVKGECSLSYRINDSLFPKRLPIIWQLCCKGRCGYVCKNPSTSRPNGVAIKPGGRMQDWPSCTPKLDWSGYLDQNLNEIVGSKYHRIRKA